MVTDRKRCEVLTMLRRCFLWLSDFQAIFLKRLSVKTFTTFFRVSLFIRNFALYKYKDAL